MPKLQLKIGAHSLTVAVPEEDKVAMLEAARQVNQAILHVKEANKVVDGERAAIMAAVQIACAPAAAGAAAAAGPSADGLAELAAAIDDALATAEAGAA
ncbi:MAG: cell division protein ZapA [Betaproteobacteria bacterium AqS2]|uniref:Cell division protein ZapA n=1 Tax=Candidatus Amphirhobacter heronislandensis TaxID=1732024 RepID=A0A930UJ47_9GAMM|nr:cell division protein ZapA [Betaproteobacteria bacterium AqS2]